MDGKLIWFTSFSCGILAPKGCTMLEAPCTHTHPTRTTIWPAMQNGKTNYWEVHTIQHNKFYFSFIGGNDWTIRSAVISTGWWPVLMNATTKPTCGSRWHELSLENRNRAMIFKYNIQTGISFHTLRQSKPFTNLVSQPYRRDQIRVAILSTWKPPLPSLPVQEVLLHTSSCLE
jgi:hypothetical protein